MTPGTAAKAAFVAKHARGDSWLAELAVRQIAAEGAAFDREAMVAALATMRQWIAAQRADTPAFSREIDEAIDFKQAHYRASKWLAERAMESAMAPFAKPEQDDKNETVLAYPDGWRWVRLSSMAARKREAEVTGRKFAGADYGADRGGLYALRDADGWPIGFVSAPHFRPFDRAEWRLYPKWRGSARAAEAMGDGLAVFASLASARIDHVPPNGLVVTPGEGKGFNKHGLRSTFVGGRLHAEDHAAQTSDQGDFLWLRNGGLHRDGDAPALLDARGRAEWWQNGKRHRVGGPAVVDEASWQWWHDGALHRDDGPATGNSSGTKWYKHGKPHRLDGPAVERADGAVEYWAEGKRHRPDGPAVVHQDGREEWWLDGVLHRADGPARTSPAGRREYWLNGGRHRADGPAVVPATKMADEEWWVDGNVVAAPAESDWSDLYQAMVRALYVMKGFDKNGRWRPFSPRAPGLRPILRRFDHADARPWSPSDAAAVAAALSRSAHVSEEFIATAKWAKAVRLSRFLALRDFAGIPAEEAASLADLLDSCDDLELSDGASLRSLAHGVRHAHRPTGRRGERRDHVEFAYLASLPTRKKAVATGVAPLAAVADAQAPVFAHLTTEDGELPLRRIDGVPYRPILKPDSWRPITETEFRDCAIRGAAWRDNPFHRKPFYGAPALSVSEIATARSRDCDANVLAGNACLARAGTLAVVDGVVYRPTAEPTLHIVQTTTRSGIGTRLAWRLGDDLAMTDSQRTFPAASDGWTNWTAFWGRPCLGNVWQGETLAANVADGCLSFPAEAAGDAARVVAAWAGEADGVSRRHPLRLAEGEPRRALEPLIRALAAFDIVAVRQCAPRGLHGYDAPQLELISLARKAAAELDAGRHEAARASALLIAEIAAFRREWEESTPADALMSALAQQAAAAALLPHLDEEDAAALSAF